MGSLLLVSLAGPASAEPMALVESLLLDADACATAAEYPESNTEWVKNWSDEGTATFSSQLDVPGLFGYAGTGGHQAAVRGCWSDTVDGWMAVWSDFSWGGQGATGHPGGITIHSDGHGEPYTYSSKAGLVSGYNAAKVRASGIDGTFPADAIHGGIGIPESSGVAKLRAYGDPTLQGYSYSWNYEGRGDLLGIDQFIHENCDGWDQICSHVDARLLAVYGTGSDEDLVT